MRALWKPNIPMAIWTAVMNESAILLSDAGTNGPQCFKPTLGLRGMSDLGSGIVIVEEEPEEEPEDDEEDDSDPEEPDGGM